MSCSANAVGLPVSHSGAEVAHLKSFVPMQRLICPRKDQHAQGSNLAQAAHGLQLTPRMMLHGCEAATLTPSSDKRCCFKLEQHWLAAAPPDEPAS